MFAKLIISAYFLVLINGSFSSYPNQDPKFTTSYGQLRLVTYESLWDFDPNIWALTDFEIDTKYFLKRSDSVVSIKWCWKPRKPKSKHLMEIQAIVNDVHIQSWKNSSHLGNFIFFIIASRFYADFEINFELQNDCIYARNVQKRIYHWHLYS